MVNGMILTEALDFMKTLWETHIPDVVIMIIQEKTEEVFYDPKTATKELVDSVFEMANQQRFSYTSISICQTMIRHNIQKIYQN